MRDTTMEQEVERLREVCRGLHKRLAAKTTLGNATPEDLNGLVRCGCGCKYWNAHFSTCRSDCLVVHEGADGPVRCYDCAGRLTHELFKQYREAYKA